MNINWPKVVGILGCVAAAVSAFLTESDKQNTSKTIKELTERVSKLEKN